MAGISTREINRVLNEELKKRASVKRITKGDLTGLAKVVIFEMRGMTTKGISPIKGNRRFERYKNPENYPGKVKKKYPSKKNRPVNLFLSGNFLLTGLRSKVKTGRKASITVGFFDKKNIAKERGHREGAGGQPKRPIIPKGNERYAVRIVRAFKKRLFRILDKRL